MDRSQVSQLTAILRQTPKGQLKYDRALETQGHLDSRTSSIAIVKEVAEEIQAMKTKTVWDVAERFQNLQRQKEAEVEEPEHEAVKEARKNSSTRVKTVSSDDEENQLSPLAEPREVSIFLSPVSPADRELADYERERQEEVTKKKFSRYVAMQERREKLQKHYEDRLAKKTEEIKRKADQDEAAIAAMAEKVSMENAQKQREASDNSKEEEGSNSELFMEALNKSLEQCEEAERKCRIHEIAVSLSEIIEEASGFLNGLPNSSEFPSFASFVNNLETAKQLLDIAEEIPEDSLISAVNDVNVALDDNKHQILVERNTFLKALQEKTILAEEEEKKRKRFEENRIAAEAADALKANELSKRKEQQQASQETRINHAYEAKYRAFMTLINASETAIKPAESDSKFRFGLHKAITTPVNAINVLSSEHIQDKYMKLKNLLLGEPVPTVGEAQFNVSQHELGLDLAKNLLARKFVDQGSDVISVKPEQAFSMAAIAVSLWSQFPDFGELFLAYLFRACPFLVPYHVPQDYKSEEEYLKSLRGLIRLYSAITISRLASDVSERDHPHGLGNIWALICSHLNGVPVNNVTALLIAEVLTICGHALIKTYGKMFFKMLSILQDEFFAQIQNVTEQGFAGPVSRLEEILRKTLETGQINEPKDLLPAGFL